MNHQYSMLKDSDSKEGKVSSYVSKERKRMRIWPIIYSICASVDLESLCRGQTLSHLLQKPLVKVFLLQTSIPFHFFSKFVEIELKVATQICE